MQNPRIYQLLGFPRLYLWAAELLYHRFAWAYDAVAWVVSLGYWSRWRRDALHYLLPGLILETGFGTGALLIEMVQRGHNVIGLEPSKQMHEVTRRKTARKNVQAKLVNGRTQHLPFKDKIFNTVLSTFPTNYIFEKDTQHEIFRVLELGGRWVIIGVGVDYKSALINWLVGWFLGKMDHPWMQTFMQCACEVGFRFSVIEHETEAYSLPVILLERTND